MTRAVASFCNALYDDHTGGGAEVSQDQISYLVLGLAFLHKFVENIYIKPTNGDAGFFIDNEVKDITHRISIMLSQRVKHIERLKSGNNIHNYEFIAVR